MSAKSLPQFGKVVTSMIRALGRRVATADTHNLMLLVEARDEVDRAIQMAVDGHRAMGFSWSEIGQGLGITKQAACQRFGKE